MGYREETVAVRGREVRLLRGGKGRPLLFLHDTFGYAWGPLCESLAARYEVFLPAHPGCAGSAEGFDDVDAMEDLIFHYLDLCEALSVERPVVVGASLGGWIGAEWAVRYGHALQSLALIDALGLRLPEAPAADIFSLDPASTRQLLFADPTSAPALDVIPDTPKPDMVVATLEARQTLARFAWQFPDNPKLLRYLHRVRVPTLIVWGDRDGFVPLAHGKAYHERIANSELFIVPDAGHFPHIERPESCAKVVLNFLLR